MNSLTDYPLRSLTIGEIFDRAVTIYVRNFAVFSSIVLALLLPLGVLNYLAFPDRPTDITAILSGRVAQTQPNSASVLGTLALLILVVLSCSPFVNNAVALGVAALYRGERPSFVKSFAASFRRWPAVLGTVFLCLMIGLGAYLAVAVVAGVAFGIGFAIYSGSKAAGIVVFVFAGILLLAILFAFVLLVVAFVMALYATAIERMGPASAIGSAFRRTFASTELKKSSLIALSYLALNVGVLLVSGTLGVLALTLLKSEILQLAITTVFNTAFTSFAAIMLAVYYFDVRTRAEGLDLEVDVARLGQAP
jgi:hypothetical protein